MELESDSTPSRGPAERFTGEVWAEPVATPRDGVRGRAGIVRFAPRARTHWHAHARGQTLRVLEGVAVVQNRAGETLLVRAGQTVWTAPGEWHWHGAAGGAAMTHLALSDVDAADGAAVTWGEPVDDDMHTGATTQSPATTSPQEGNHP